MSEYITHMAVNDDCRNLALYADTTLPEIKISLQEHLRASQLGAVTSKGDRHTIDLLVESKKDWPSRTAKRMLAFFFGWRSHIAADRQLKTLFRLLEPEVYLTEEVDGPTSISIYHDLFVLRELYSSEAINPFVDNMLAANHSSRNIQQLFVGLWQNSLLRLHAFTAQDSQPESWFEQFLSDRQKFYDDVERYVEAFNNLDNSKMKYVVQTHRFYNPQDPLIRLTRSLRQGQPDRSIDLETALQDAKEQSHYARALRRNWLYLQATSEFWTGKIDTAALQERFEDADPHADPEVFEVLEDPERREELVELWHEQGGQEL